MPSSINLTIKEMRNFKKAITKIILQPFCETFGIPRWCRRPGLNDLDEKLAKYLNYRNGVFVEAGANDGYTQSNTFFLEKGLRWQGVLVEGIPELFRKCEKRRKKSMVFHGGLVSKSYHKKNLKLHYANLMSIAEGGMEDIALQEHVQEGLQCQSIEKSYTVDVPAITFEKILDEAAYPKIDFLSIDLEGYEIEALKGWNFQRYRPRYILIEVRDLDSVDDFLSGLSYTRIDQLSEHDYLYVDVSN